jgi:phosphoribosylformylglycinamidine synthase
MAFAFERAGAEPVHVHLADLPDRASVVRNAAIVAIAGGFSFADALGSGRVYADELSRRLGDLLADKVARGCPILGICNGFQALVRSGLLPGADAGRAALTHNSSGVFECRWVTMAPVSTSCIWTAGLGLVAAPVAHGEGRFVADEPTLATLAAGDRVALAYTSGHRPAAGRHPANPNGSVLDIAGVCDETGLVLGMMPHPENNVTTRQGFSGAPSGLASSGLTIFTKGVQHARSV